MNLVSRPQIFLIVFGLAASQALAMGGPENAAGLAAGASGTAAGVNFDEAAKQGQQCQQKKQKAKQIKPTNPGQAQQLEQQAKEHCKKQQMGNGQGLGDLAKMLQQLMTKGDAGDSNAGSGNNFPVTTDNPTAFFSDSEKAKRTLTGNGLEAGLADRLVRGAKAAIAQGVGFDPATDTITTPEGNIPYGAMSSAEGMAALGYSAEEIQAKMKAQADAVSDMEAQLAKFAGDGEGGGGGGGSGSGSIEIPELPSYDPTGRGVADMLGRAPASDRQLTRLYAGESIGVASDNIFEMISRRYMKKRITNAFLP